MSVRWVNGFIVVIKIFYHYKCLNKYCMYIMLKIKIIIVTIKKNSSLILFASQQKHNHHQQEGAHQEEGSKSLIIYFKVALSEHVIIAP